MARPFSILLPPSEGKAPGGTLPGWDPAGGRFGAALGSVRRTVAEALEDLGGGDQKLLGVGGEHLDRARAANASLIGAPCLPASQRFTGVVWDHLGLSSLRGGSRARARDSVLVISAVAGLVAIDDPMPDHRLKLSAALPGLGRLASFWREPLSKALNDHLEGHLVLDLLPREHAAAWDHDPTRYDLRRIELRTRDGRPGGHDAKAAKGHLARALLEARSPALALTRFADSRFLVTVNGRPLGR